MTKNVRLFILWALVGGSPFIHAETVTKTFPHAAAGTVGDIEVESSLTLLNTFDSPCVVEITYTRGLGQAPSVSLLTNGQDWSETFTRTLSAAGGETLNITPTSIAQGFFTFGIEVAADCSGGPLAQLAYTFRQDGQPSEIVSVGPGVSLKRGHCLRGQRNAGRDMGLTWLARQTNSTNSELDIFLLDDNGNELEFRRRTTDGTNTALTLSELFSTVPSQDGLVEVCNPGEDELIVQLLEFETGLSGSIQTRELQSSKRNLDCTTDASTACLHDGRFQVNVDWMPVGGSTTPGLVTRQRDSHASFRLNGLDLGVSIVDNCGAAGRYWVVHGGLTNAEFTLTVTDTQVPKTVTYESAQGIPALPVLDTAAFAICP